MSTPNLAQLKQALTIAEKIESLKSELASIVGGGSTVASIIEAASSPVVKLGKRTMSAATKAKMRAAQQARWANLKGSAPAPANAAAPTPAAKKAPGSAKKGMSAAHKAKLKAAAKARWARIRAGKETSPFKK